MPLVSLNGMQIYYETEGQGPPLILISGYSVDLTIWAGVRKQFAENFQLVLLDNRGSGRSEYPKDSFTIEQMADDVLALIEHLGLKKPFVLGGSMGGAILQSMAHRHPERIGKMILSQTFLKLPVRSVVVLNTSVHLREEGTSVQRLGEMIMPWLMSNAFLSDPAKRDLFIENMVKRPFLQTLDGQKKQLDALLKFDSSKWYHEIAVPTLVQCGEADILCPPEECHLMAKNIRGAKLHIFPKMGHSAVVEIPDEYVQVVRNFLLNVS